VIAPTPPCERFRAPARRSGFTLVEMVVTVAIMSVIMLGIGSAMIIASHALPDAGNPAGASLAAAQVADRITTELQYAIAINSYTANVIEFQVADRDGNDVSETIRYAWSSTPGDPLTRQYNSAASVTILDDVYEFKLAYDLTTTTTETPQGNESAETLLMEYTSTQDLHDYPIKDAERYAQYFFPTLPGDAVSWKVTRARFYAKADGANDGQYSIQLQSPTAGTAPSGVVIEAKPAFESSLLEGYTQQEVLFSNVSGLSPQEGLCLVFRWIANGTACQLQSQDRNVATPNSYLAKSTDREASWSTLTDQSLLYQVYGTVTTAGEPQIESSYYLDRVDIKLRQSDAEQSIVQTGVRVFNRPEVVQ
jgi:prepilin-type N-terminal cleavage/methylation domain-containing protein